jgi:hypothetical protein
VWQKEIMASTGRNEEARMKKQKTGEEKWEELKKELQKKLDEARKRALLVDGFDEMEETAGQVGQELERALLGAMAEQQEPGGSSFSAMGTRLCESSNRPISMMRSMCWIGSTSGGTSFGPFYRPAANSTTITWPLSI